MGFLTTENVVPLTAVVASTDTREQLGQRIHDVAGRKYIFCQLIADAPTVSFGNAVCFYSTGAKSAQITSSTDAGGSNAKFAGIAVNKQAAASAGQKLWIMHEGNLGKIPNSKLKSNHSPITLWAKCSTDCNVNILLSANVASLQLQSASEDSLAAPIGVGFLDDTSSKLTEGFIRALAI